jgi:hypothetical protein
VRTEDGEGDDDMDEGGVEEHVEEEDREATEAFPGDALTPRRRTSKILFFQSSMDNRK